jgi:hypothetical protein
MVTEFDTGITAAGTVQELPELTGSPVSLLILNLGTYSAAKLYKRSEKCLFLQGIKRLNRLCLKS